MIGAVHQRQDFTERLSRISAGTQFEHADLIGHQTQKAYIAKFGTKPRKQRSWMELFMVPLAFGCGVSSVMLGRLAYLTATTFEGLPPAVYKLEGRGVFLSVLILAMTLILLLRLHSGTRLKSLALGCALMHFGEPVMAEHLPDVYSHFPQTYVESLQAKAAKA